MESREFDIFAEVLANPQMSLEQLVAIGMTPDKTSLQSRDVYSQDEWVLSHFKTSNGEFDSTKFNELYNKVKSYYNVLAMEDLLKLVDKAISFHRDNIFAPREQRRNGPDFVEVKTSNPYLVTTSITELGKVGDRVKSVDELAQSNKVLLNPLTAGENLENAQWDESPNDAFWKYFTDTLVQAQWDEEGDHINPVTGVKEHHLKGENKLDLDGNFYYEKLDGRDVYDRRVLNKMNVLTTDGSWANQYDFFDSDDIKLKSIGGSIMKNMALVGSMFVSGIGPWVIGASVATQLAGFGATLGKMLVGSDSPTLSAIEGWSKSLNRLYAKTEYSQENPWSLENMINLIGDVAGQLKELRFLFEKTPLIFKDTNVMTTEGLAAKLAEYRKIYNQTTLSKLGQLRDMPNTKANTAFREIMADNAMRAQADLNSYIKGYNSIGSALSKGYMTMLTVLDTYGEAKKAGASDMEATLLTLGHAIGEYGILSTGLGEWIMPELRAGKYKAKAITEALLDLNKLKETVRDLANLSLKEGKKEFVKRALNIGKGIAKAEYSNVEKAGMASLAAAAGESAEEVSEELLADFSKGCYDVYKWLKGEDTRINTFGYNFSNGEWNAKDVLTRYGMSAVGGFIGGGLTNAFTNYQTINSFSNMTSKTAMLELVYMARNGGLKDFIKQVDKMDLGNSKLSMEVEEIDGELLFSPGTLKNNQDKFAKDMIKKLVQIILNIMDANGATLSDNSLLSRQTDVLKDLRFNALHRSTTAGAFLNEYNTIVSEIVSTTNSINSKLDAVVDKNKDGIITDREERKNKLSESDKKIVEKEEEELKDLLKKLKDLHDGKRSLEFVENALFEMTTNLNQDFGLPTFIQYVESKTGKDINDIDNQTLNNYREEYKIFNNIVRKDQIRTLATIYRQMNEMITDVINNSVKNYTESEQDIKNLNYVMQLFNRILSSDESWIDEALNRINDKILATGMLLVDILGSESDKNILHDIAFRLNTGQTVEELKQQNELKTIDYKNALDEILINNLPTYLNKIVEQGFINSETKKTLLDLALLVMLNLNTKAIEYEELATNGLIPDAEFDIFGNVSNSPYTQDLLELLSAMEEIKKLSQTPFEKNLNEFAIGIGLNALNITQLLEKINSILDSNKDNLSEFRLNEDIEFLLNNAIQTIKMYRAVINGARTDNANLENLFGYNRTLNEVALKLGENRPALAEIDSKTADLFLADINTNLTKLEFALKLLRLNKGLKLSLLDRVGTVAKINTFRRLRNIVTVPNDDKLRSWNGFDLFERAIKNLKLHSELESSKKLSLNQEEKELLLKEATELLDAIYDFFQANLDAFTNIDKLKQFISGRFQLFTLAANLLNENQTAIDDNSMLWFIASRAALKSSDFYSMYGQTINPTNPIAPIPTQELAIYNNVANIINGNVFSAFAEAYRQSMVEEWGLLSTNERVERLRLLGKNSENLILLLASTDFDDEAYNFLPIPKFKNIVLTEGIPGSGKTSAVFKYTIDILKKYYPDTVKNVHIIHGANPKGAEKIASDCNLDKNTTKTFGLKEGLKEISSSWTEYLKNGNIYTIPSGRFTRSKAGELINALTVNQTQNPPSLIILDEVSQFTMYDLLLIDQFALKYGITVLVAGDFDQSGIIGLLKVNLPNGKEISWSMESNRYDFIRSLKLGVSMRTDNSLKSLNILMLLALIEKARGTCTFKYFEDLTGLYGDKVHSYSDNKDDTNLIQTVLEDVNKMISTLKRDENGNFLKIGFIYNNENSPIYKALQDDKYKKFIDFKLGSSALGSEGLYYIIDLDPSIQGYTLEEYIKDLYTGISRALQGSIVIAPLDLYQGTLKLDNKVYPEMIPESYGKSAIEKYSLKTKELLTKLYPAGETPKFIPRTANNQVPTLPELKQPELKQPELKLPNVIPPPSLNDLPKVPTFQERKEAFLKFVNESTTIEQLNEGVNNLKDNEVINNQEVQEAISKKRLELTKTDDESFEPLEILPILLTNEEEIRKNIEKFLNTQYLLLYSYSEDFSKSDVQKDDFVYYESGEDMYPGRVVAYNPENKTYQIISNLGIVEIHRKDIKFLFKDILAEDFLTPPEFMEIPYEGIPIYDNVGISEQLLEQQIDNSNTSESVNKATLDNNIIKIAMLLHTFNTYETGVHVDLNGFPVYNGEEWGELRIDSVNGLIKIDENIKGQPRKNILEYITQIGKLRSILFNTLNKSDICEKIKFELGLDDIYVTFAIKNTARPGNGNKESGREYVGNSPNNFEKGISEKTLFNGSKDERSHDWNVLSLVAIIGTGKTDVLELPLMTLSSPLTLVLIINENDENMFEEVFQIFMNFKGNTNEAVKEVIKIYKGNPKYKELIDLFELFDNTDNAIFYNKHEDWTPAKDLHLEGPMYVKSRGYYQMEEGLSYDQNEHPEEEWTPISQFLETTIDGHTVKRGDCVISSRVMSSQDGTINGSDELVVNPGHSFILYSNNTDLNTDYKLVELFEKLNWSDEKKEEHFRATGEIIRNEVALFYVIPPKASMKEYFDNILKILQGKKNEADPVGNLFTSYRILEKLLFDEDNSGNLIIDNTIRNLLDSNKQLLFDRLVQTILDIKRVEHDRDLGPNLEVKDKLLVPTEWSDLGFTDLKVALTSLLDRSLLSLIYTKNTIPSMIGLENAQHYDDTMLLTVTDLLKAKGIDGVYYNTELVLGLLGVGPFTYPKQGDNYTINGKPFRIHGKIDSYTFRGSMGLIVSEAVEDLIDDENRSYIDSSTGETRNHKKGRDNGRYFHKNSNIYKKQYTPLNGYIDFIRNKTGIDTTNYFNGVNENEALDNIILDLNKGGKYISFRINGDLYILELSNSGFNISDLNNNPITNVTNGNINGEYSFKVTISGMDCDVVFNKDTRVLEVTPIQQQQNNSAPVIIIDDYEAYRQAAPEVLEPLIDIDEELADIFMLETQKEFIQALQNLDPIVNGEDTPRLDILKELQEKYKLKGSKFLLELKLIEDMIKVEEFKINGGSFDTNELLNDQCTPTYKLQF